MKALLLRLSGQTLIYGLSGAVVSLMGLFTLPVFARALDRDELGALELMAVGVAVLAIIVDLGLSSASQRSYFDYSAEQPEERRAVLATAILTCMALGLSVTIVVIALREPLSDWLFDGHSYDGLIVVSIVALPLSVLAQLFREIMRLTNRPWPYLASSLAAAVAGAAIGIVAVTQLDGGPTGVQVGGVVGALIAVAYGFVVVRRDLGIRFSVPELRVMLRYGLPLVPTAAALWGLSLLDRILLAQFTDLDEVALYGVANRLASVLMLGVIAFTTAYVPFFLSLYAEDPVAERTLRGRICLYVALALFLPALVLGVFAEEAIAIVAPGYEDAAPSAAVLLMGIAVYGVGMVGLAGISIARATGRIAVHTATALVVNVAACLVLIPLFGQFGAAIATLLAYCALTLLYFRTSQSLDRVPIETRRVLSLIAATAVGIAIAFVPWSSEAIAIPIKLAVIAIVVAALWPLGVIGPMEREFLRELLRGPRGRPA